MVEVKQMETEMCLLLLHLEAQENMKKKQGSEVHHHPAVITVIRKSRGKGNVYSSSQILLQTKHLKTEKMQVRQVKH